MTVSKQVTYHKFLNNLSIIGPRNISIFFAIGKSVCLCYISTFIIGNVSENYKHMK